jgi:hypothetical protein
MSHRKSDLGIPRPRKSAKVVLALVAAPEASPASRRLAETLANFCDAAHPTILAEQAEKTERNLITRTSREERLRRPALPSGR